MQGDLDNPGIIPLSIEYIFDQIKHEDHCITVKASYMEIYNEVITDLISADHTNLKIHETLDRDIYVGDLTQTLVTCSHSALQVLQAGQGKDKFLFEIRNSYMMDAFVCFFKNSQSNCGQDEHERTQQPFPYYLSNDHR